MVQLRCARTAHRKVAHPQTPWQTYRCLILRAQNASKSEAYRALAANRQVAAWCPRSAATAEKCGTHKLRLFFDPLLQTIPSKRRWKNSSTSCAATARAAG